jgi:hypothetical protein
MSACNRDLKAAFCCILSFDVRKIERIPGVLFKKLSGIDLERHIIPGVVQYIDSLAQGSHRPYLEIGNKRRFFCIVLR